MFITNFVKILLLFSNVVISSEISNDAYKQTLIVDRVVRDVYKYKHPPEEAIPVAVVFDDDGGREGKATGNKVSDSNANIESNNKTSDIKNPTIIKLSGDLSVKTSDTDKPKILFTTENYLQIPVAVIYDGEPTPIKKNRKTSRRSKIRNQSQSNQRHPEKVEQRESYKKATTIVDIENTSIISATEKISERVKPRKAAIDNTKVQKGIRERDPVVPIVQSENKVFGHSGDFRYSYEGGDGTQVFQNGELKSYDDNNKGEAVVGGFSYTDKNGQDFSLSYTADENGYRPVGDHLPTPPPIPPAIERALRYLATKSTPEPVTEPTEDSN